MHVGESLHEVELQTASGVALEFRALLDRVLLVQCLPYYG